MLLPTMLMAVMVVDDDSSHVATMSGQLG